MRPGALGATVHVMPQRSAWRACRHQAADQALRQEGATTAVRVYERRYRHRALCRPCRWLRRMAMRP